MILSLPLAGCSPSVRAVFSEQHKLYHSPEVKLENVINFLPLKLIPPKALKCTSNFCLLKNHRQYILYKWGNFGEIFDLAIIYSWQIR